MTKNLNLLNDYYNFNELVITFIPNNNDNLIIELDSPVVDFKYKLSIKKKIPDFYKKIYTSRCDEYKKEYRSIKSKMIKTDRIYIPMYDIYYIIKPILTPLAIGKKHEKIRKYRGNTVYEDKGYIWEKIHSIRKESITKFSGDIGRYYYGLILFDLLPKKKIRSLFIFTNMAIIGLRDYLTYRNNYSTNSYNDINDCYVFLDDKLESEFSTSEDYLKLAKSKYIFNLFEVKGSICKNNEIIKEKYEFINIANTLLDFKLRKNNYNELHNCQLFLNYVYIVLKHLKKGGSALIQIFPIYSRLSSDIIYITKKYFKKVFLSKNKLNSALSDYHTLVLKNFIGITDKDLKELETIMNKWLKIKKCNEYSEDSKKYVYSILDFKNTPNKYINQLKFYFEIYELRRLIIGKRINNIYNKILDMNDDEYKKYIDELVLEQTVSTYNYLNSINIPIIKKNEKQSINDILDKDIFEKIKIIDLLIKKKKIYVENMNDLLEKLNINRQKLITFRNLIDNLDFNKWSNTTKNVRIYKNFLSEMVKSYTYFKPSQGFLKMYEILSKFQLFPKNNKKISTMSICEAPGQFILAMNHYLKTKTTNEEYIWYANSLNPNSEQVKQKYGWNIISDTYGLIKKYKDKWLFGKDNTGDITKLQNILDIRNRLSKLDIDLITSDCGLSSYDFKTYSYGEEKISLINFCQILFILMCLPKNKSFVLKTFLPQIQPVNISLNYILYLLFKKINYYKPLQNRESGEFYIIGRGYKGIDDILLKKLIEFHKKNNFDRGVIEVDSTFLYYYQKNIEILVDSNVNEIKRKLVYYKNYDIFNKFREDIEKIKKSKCKEWIKYFNIEKIIEKDMI